MKKYLFLSSVFLMTMAGANAADKIITSANTCTVDVLGVSNNNAVANTIATWDLIDYTLDPGEYLNVTDTSVTETTCPAGSYCVGGGYTVETANNSIAQCPTTHPNSATGAGADTQCYTACTVDMVAKATAVSGNDYYGTGVDTCGATACETGYHVDGGGIELVEKTPLVPISLTTEGIDDEYISQGGTVDSNDIAIGLSTQNTWATEFAEGVIYGKASCQPKADTGNEYIFNNVESIISGSITMEKLHADLVATVGEARADVYTDFFEVTLAGGEDMNAEEQSVALKKYFAVSIPLGANYSTDSTGRYCYCQMDGFMPTGGTKQIVTSAPWVFNSGYVSADVCANRCALNCAGGSRDDTALNLAIRAAVVGALGYTETGGICAANTINIDWNPDNNGEHIKNMCTYEGSITVPADPVKPGYTFTGWKLLESTTTE